MENKIGNLNKHFLNIRAKIDWTDKKFWISWDCKWLNIVFMGTKLRDYFNI